MYVKDQPGKWEDYLHLVEFAYNNHYQASARYSHFENFMEGNAIPPSLGVIQLTC